jgi:hypothetical protein
MSHRRSLKYHQACRWYGNVLSSHRGQLYHELTPSELYSRNFADRPVYMCAIQFPMKDERMWFTSALTPSKEELQCSHVRSGTLDIGRSFFPQAQFFALVNMYVLREHLCYDSELCVSRTS